MTSFNSCERPVKETIVRRMKEEEGKADSKGILLIRKIGNWEDDNRKERERDNKLEAWRVRAGEKETGAAHH